MAQYRLSVSVIKRSEGRSVTAAAAYRAGAKIRDHRTGLVHDFSHRRGIIHTELMAPSNTPDWMLDRQKLWNAVEAAEKRRDGQLSREVQLSLPHELDPDQRLDLVRGYVAKHFVSQGMIADLAVHAPTDGDPRNHHAHILLTMRNLTDEGFGPKNRDWNTNEQTMTWREEWANHQNRAYERLGLDVRVDHRSYEKQGIDREPTQHMGPNACEIEKKGERSRIGEENRAIEERNSQRAELYRQKAEIQLSYRPFVPPASRRPVQPDSPVYQRELTRREKLWAERADQLRETIDHRQRLALLDLDQKKHQRQLANLKADQEKRNRMMTRTMGAEVEAIDRRMQAKGITRLFRDIFGRTKADALQKERLVRTIEGIKVREREEIGALDSQQRRDRDKVIEKHDRQRKHLEKVLATQKEQRDRSLSEARGYTMRDPKELRAHFGTSQKRREEDRPPPKPDPVMKPAPPKAAGPSPMPSPGGTDAQFARKAAEWAKTPKGRESTEGYERDRAKVLGTPAPEKAPEKKLDWAKPKKEPSSKPAFDRSRRDKDRERDR